MKIPQPFLDYSSTMTHITTHVFLNYSSTITRNTQALPASRSETAPVVPDTSSVAASVVSDTDGGGGDTSSVAASVVSETASSVPYKEKFRCGMCQLSLTGFARTYWKEPEKTFECPYCSTTQKFGNDKGVFFTVVAQADDDEDEYVKRKLKSLEEVTIGDCVKIEFRKPKPAEYAWVVNIQKTSKKKDDGAQTRARSRAEIIFEVVFEIESSDMHKFSTQKNKITHTTRPNWYEEQRIAGTIGVKSSIQDLDEAERNKCIDLTNGGHPSDDEVMHKYQTIITYDHFARFLAPRKWLGDDIINFYMQACLLVFLMCYSQLPHISLTTSSYITHNFLMCYSQLPHTLLDVGGTGIHSLEYHYIVSDVFCKQSYQGIHNDRKWVRVRVRLRKRRTVDKTLALAIVETQVDFVSGKLWSIPLGTRGMSLTPCKECDGA